MSVTSFSAACILPGHRPHQANAFTTQEQDTVFIEQRRGKKISSQQAMQVAPVEDALAEDEFQKGKTSYQHLKTVTPSFTPLLREQIHTAIQRYKDLTGQPIPAPTRWLTREPAENRTILGKALPPEWKSNKVERLKAALWVMAQLPPAASDTEAINQLACVLQSVESTALEQALETQVELSPPILSIDPKALKLTEPVLETVQGQPLKVSYGIQHVTLFSRNGAIQVQCLPAHLRGVDYRTRASVQPDAVLFDKVGADSQPIWR